MKQLTALRTATSSRSFSICRVILGGNVLKREYTEQDRSGLLEIQTVISGQMDFQTNYFVHENHESVI